MFDIKEENSLEVAKELFPLISSHYNEVEVKSGQIPLNINWNLLESFFTTGLISVMVARKDGQVVGYFANMIIEDFMTSLKVAKELALYIDPAHRHGKLFLKLMNATALTLKAKGVSVQYITFKAGHNTELPLRCGFSHTETTYQKVLEG